MEEILSYRIVWDGLTDYENRQSFYDNEGKKHGCSGLDYFLKNYLCHGAKFSSEGEALARKLLNMNDSPNCNSLHDAEFYHPLGNRTLETRCYKKTIQYAYQTEIGGNRCPTKESDREGKRTFINASLRCEHKIMNITHFCFINIERSPELYLSVIPGSRMLDLWACGEGVFVKWRNCRVNIDCPYDPPIFGRRPLLPLSFSKKKMLDWFYEGKGFHQIKWIDANPFGVSEKRQKENIEKFNNQQGIFVKFPPSSSEKKISIDDRIKNENIKYTVSPNAVEINKRFNEVVDMFVDVEF